MLIFNFSGRREAHKLMDQIYVRYAPSLVGVASLILDILLLFTLDQIFLLDHGLYMVVKKFYRLESAQKIHAGRG